MPALSLRAVAVIILGLGLSAAATDTAPNLELHDLKGARHKLTDYRGKPVVLNFWATWCVPCATEMPLLNEMQKRYEGRVVFIAASVDFDDVKPSVQAFIRKHHAEALTVMMGAELDNLQQFGLAQAMPGTVFIDGEGNIVERASGKLKRPFLEAQMRKLAGEPASLPPRQGATGEEGQRIEPTLSRLSQVSGQLSLSQTIPNVSGSQTWPGPVKNLHASGVPR